MIEVSKLLERFGAQLPVAEIAGRLCGSLRRCPRAVVTAPPGAGKSTLLPLLLSADAPEGKVLMLEPRRLAARQIAMRMAQMGDEKVGETVGYRVRFDTKVSSSTRIEVLTEGIMSRMLVDDPTLDGVQTLIFDEFHERSLVCDEALAMALEVQRVLRPDLRIVVMSATIDAAGLCSALDAPLIESRGRIFDVEIIHSQDISPRDIAGETAAMVRRAHREQKGDILAFLPGQGEIMRCAELLQGLPGDTTVLPLYGLLPPEEQRRVLVPQKSGRRVVLATPIAETSLTIQGVSTVVDSGFCRTMVYEPSAALSRLETVRISLDMARQRAGRAGRLGPGTCYRLWSKGAEHRMRDCREPEILTADLAPLVLDLAAWGESDPATLPWVTPPPAGAVKQARSLLRMLGALDDAGRITGQGRRLWEMPCHPRIARMLITAENDRRRALAADVAALLEEKDPLGDGRGADLALRVEMLRQARRSGRAGRWQRIIAVAERYRRLMRVDTDNGTVAPEEAGQLVAVAFPERVAQKASDGRYRLAAGGYVTLSDDDDLLAESLLAVAAMGNRVFLAAPLSQEDAAAMATWRDRVAWDSRQGRVVAQRELCLGLLVLDAKPAGAEAREKGVAAICDAAKKEGLTMFDFGDDVQRLQRRVAAVAGWHPEMDLPDVSTEHLLDTATEWLPLYIGKASSVAELRKIDMCRVITGLLGYEGGRAVDRLAPSYLRLPRGRNARIDYRPGAAAPVLSARLEDCFGLHETPRVDDGRVPLLMELLSPGFKPVQITSDLRNFWKTTYFEVRKELKRRYPKHPWPDNPE